jgi:Carboxypeptidase regulatory-like domain
MRIAGIAFTLVLLVSLMLPPAAVAQANVTVTGQVKGQDGNPKQFSSVALDGPGRYAAATNTEGVFTIPNVKPGKYTIRVRQGNQVTEFSRDVGGGPIDLVVKW